MPSARVGMWKGRIASVACYRILCVLFFRLLPGMMPGDGDWESCHGGLVLGLDKGGGVVGKCVERWRQRGYWKENCRVG